MSRGKWYELRVRAFVIILVAVLGTVMFPVPAFGAGPVYEAELLGVFGGAIIHVEVDPQNPDIVYAVSWYAVWKSTDRGETWNLLKTANLTQYLKVDPTNSSVMYLARRTNIEKTINGGDTWTTLTGVGGSYAFAIDPVDTQRVYTGGQGMILISDDGGENWADVVVAGMGLVHVIDIDPNTPSTLFVGDRGAKIWRSKDSGDTWTQVHSSSGSRVSVQVAPSDSNIVYASGGVSYDGGDTWIYAAPTAWIVRVYPTNPSVAYYGQPGAPVYATNNGGKSFYEIRGIKRNYDATEVESLAIDAVYDILYVGGDTVYKGYAASTGIVSVVESDTSIYANSFTDVEAGVDIVWVTSDSRGVHRTEDQGGTWQHSILGMNGLDSIRKIAPHPTDADIAYAGHEGVLFKTIDRGKSWNQIFTGSFPGPSIDYSDPDIVYVGSSGDLYRSINGGEDWTSLVQTGAMIYTFSQLPGKIYTIDAGDLLSSVNQGDAWLNLGAIPSSLDAMDPVNPGTLYSSKDLDGLYRTVNGGGAWSKIVTFPDVRPRDVEILGNGDIWVTAFGGTGLYQSEDEGVTWLQVMPNSTIRITQDPWNVNAMFVLSTHSIDGVWWVAPEADSRMAPNPPAGGEPDQATIQVSSCQLLGRSNTVYQITNDLEALGEGSCFLFPRGVHNVTIDGQEHTITTAAFGIFGDDVWDITIQNITVTQAEDGPNSDAIHLGNARNVIIQDTTAVAAREYASAVAIPGVFSENVTLARNYLSGGIFGRTVRVHATNTNITASTITIDSIGTGIELFMSSQSNVSGNTISGGGASSNQYGIVSRYSSGGVIESNTITGNYRTESAALKLEGCDSFTIQNNPLISAGPDTAVGGWAIHLESSNENRIQDNIVTFQMRYSHAIRLDDSNANVLERNTLVADAVGVRGLLLRDSNDNHIVENSVEVSGQDATTGLELQESAGNLISRNALLESNPDVSLTDAGPNTWCGNYYSQTSPGCPDADGDGICDSPVVLGTDNVDYNAATSPDSTSTCPASLATLPAGVVAMGDMLAIAWVAIVIGAVAGMILAGVPFVQVVVIAGIAVLIGAVGVQAILAALATW